MKNILPVFLIVIGSLSIPAVSTAQVPIGVINIDKNFSLTAFSGHRLRFTRSDRIMTIESSAGQVLASGKVFQSVSAYPRQGRVVHGLSVYGATDSTRLEYTLVLETRITIAEASRSLPSLGPEDFLDTRQLIGNHFWITDTQSGEERLNSRLFETSTEVGKVFPFIVRAPRCTDVFH